MYIYTDLQGNKIEIKYFSSIKDKTPADQALKYLKKLGKNTLVWTIVGGDNPIDKIQITLNN